jgi:hypothetical protein
MQRPEHEETSMFSYGGYKPLWPIIFFIPWLYIGAAMLRESFRQRAVARPRRDRDGRR